MERSAARDVVMDVISSDERDAGLGRPLADLMQSPPIHGPATQLRDRVAPVAEDLATPL
jgi:hypothetical protein